METITGAYLKKGLYQLDDVDDSPRNEMFVLLKC
jgi:hypothetical protein